MTFDDQWCFNPRFPAWGPKMPPRCSHWTPFASHPGRLTSPTSTRDLPRNLPWIKPWTLDDLGIYHPKRGFFYSEYHGEQWDSTKKHWDFVMIFRFNHLKYQFYHRNSCCIPTPCHPPGLWQWTQELLRLLPPRTWHWKHGENVSYWKHLIAPLKPTLIRLFNYVYHRLTVHHYLQTRQFLLYYMSVWTYGWSSCSLIQNSHLRVVYSRQAHPQPMKSEIARPFGLPHAQGRLRLGDATIFLFDKFHVSETKNGPRFGDSHSTTENYEQIYIYIYTYT